MLAIKNMILAVTLSGVTALGACNKDSVSFNQEDLDHPISIFPTAPSTWINSQGSSYYSSGFIGDVMPYFANDSFHLFYLHDGDASGGYHPIHSFITKDLLHYKYGGRMIPFGVDNDQDRAIGTGSVIKSNNTYYFFYTGHNDLHWNTTNPVEGVMYATSTDLVNWTKKTSFVLYPSTSSGYNANDFRDPFVLYNDATSEYWMLVSAVKNGTPVIALYTTSSLASNNWVLKNPFFITDNASYGTMECADVFKMGNYWYLLFSENGVNKTTHYRMSSSLGSTWTKPANDVLDGEFYYAAKTASDGTNRYLFGWTYRKSGSTDYGSNIWAGNLVPHQIIQNSDGTLSVKTPEAINNLFTSSKSLVPDSSKNVTASSNTYTMQADGFAGFGLINGQKRITTTIKGLQNGGDAGFAFGYGRPGSGDYYKLRFKNGEAYLLKVQGKDEYIDCRVAFPYTPGNNISIDVVIDNTVLVATVNGKTTLTGRSYWLPNAKWGIYSLQSGVGFENLQIFSF